LNWKALLATPVGIWQVKIKKKKIRVEAQQLVNFPVNEDLTQAAGSHASL